MEQNLILTTKQKYNEKIDVTKALKWYARLKLGEQIEVLLLHENVLDGPLTKFKRVK